MIMDMTLKPTLIQEANGVQHQDVMTGELNLEFKQILVSGVPDLHPTIMIT